MSDYPPTYPPPSYGFANPVPSDDINKGAYNPTQHQPQQQWAQPTVVAPIVIQDVAAVENYMIWSVLNILCCCWILGCVACFFSLQTDTAKNNGNLQEAINHSRTARTVNIVSTVLGIILNIFLILYYTNTF